MKKNNQTLIFGALGLAAILGSVYAVNQLPLFADADSSADVSISVHVVGVENLTINSIKDGQIMFDYLQEVEYTFQNVSGYRFELTYVDKNKTVEVYRKNFLTAMRERQNSPVGAILADAGSLRCVGEGASKTCTGTDTFDLSVKDWFGAFAFGTYKLSAYNNDSTVPSDTVTFVYKAYQINNTGEFDEKGNPILEIITSPEIDKIDITFEDANGKKQTVTIDTSRDTVTRFPLDLDKLGNLADGFEISNVTAYDRKGNKINGVSATSGGEINVSVDDFRPAPNTPNTGNIALFDEINLSKSDIMSGLVVVFVAALLVAFSILKRTGRKSSEKK